MAKYIFAADIHLSDKKPVARLEQSNEEWINIQLKKFEEILKNAQQYNAPVIIAGDFFDKPKVSQYLEARIIYLLKSHKVDLYIVPGQHDMPYHNFDLLDDSSLGVLEAADCIFICKNNQRMEIDAEANIISLPFGYDIQNKISDSGFNILVTHQFVYKDKKPFPTASDNQKGNKILKKYSKLGFNMIVSGDNHEPFETATSKCILYNIGSMTRLNTKQWKHQPRVILFDSEKKSIRKLYLTIEPPEKVLSKEHLEKKKEEEKRFNDFIDKLNTNFQQGTSFENNLQAYFSKNNTSKIVKEIIYDCLEEE